MKSGPGRARSEGPVLQNWPGSRKGPAPLPAQETLWWGSRGPSRAGGQATWQAGVSLLPRPSEGLQLWAGRVCPHWLPFLSSHSWPLLPLLGNPSCHLAGFPLWPAFPMSSQDAASLLPSPSVFPNLWWHVPVHTLMDSLQSATPLEPLSPGHLHVPGPLDSTSRQRNPWCPLTKPAPQCPVAQGKAPSPPQPSSASSIVSHLPAVSKPRHGLPQSLQIVPSPRPHARSWVRAPTLAHLDNSDGVVFSCHRRDPCLLGLHTSHPHRNPCKGLLWGMRPCKQAPDSPPRLPPLGLALSHPVRPPFPQTIQEGVSAVRALPSLPALWILTHPSCHSLLDTFLNPAEVGVTYHTPLRSPPPP